MRFLRVLAESRSVNEAITRFGVSRSTVSEWRQDPNFLRMYDDVRSKQGLTRDSGKVTFDPFAERRPVPGLVEFREKVFGFPSTPTQRAFAEAYDDSTNLVIFWLAPAGAGKDVTTMQAVAHAAASGVDRIGCVMENQKQAKKRIDAFLDPYFTSHEFYKRAPGIPGGMKPVWDFIDEWGPWKWSENLRLPDGSPPARTKWDAYNKWFVGRVHPDADSSLWALGLKEAIAGSRMGLLVASDLFTVENQKSEERHDTYELIDGTIDSRLDDEGRLIVLNHHVAPANRSMLSKLIKAHVGTARVVHQNGDYTKYANGVAVIRTPALREENGIVVSYWPERFPVESRIVFPDGRDVPAADLTDEEQMEAAGLGAKRRRGLEDRRKRMGDRFNWLYQQDDRASTLGDFTDEILEACFDTDRTFGVMKPHEQVVVSVDPARSGGAAFTTVAGDLRGFEPIIYLVQFGIHEGLGFSGMRRELIRKPIEDWRPSHLVWEINYEEETPKHQDAEDVLRRYNVNYEPFRTQHNRSSGEYAVMRMADDMRDGLIRFPAKTLADTLRLEDFLDHFRNFESTPYTQRRHATGSGRLPDDACLAFWMGWTFLKQLHRRRMNRKRQGDRVGASPAVQSAFSGYRTR